MKHLDVPAPPCTQSQLLLLRCDGRGCRPPHQPMPQRYFSLSAPQVYRATGPKWRLVWGFTLLPEYQEYRKNYSGVCPRYARCAALRC